MKRARMWLLVLLLIYGAWCVLLVGCQRSMMFPRRAAGPAGPVPAGVDVIAQPIDRDGGTVSSWLCPAPTDAPRALVVFAHGNAELIDHQGELVARYHALACDVLLLEYRGYGNAAGSPSQDGIVRDAIATFDTVRARPWYAGHRGDHARSFARRGGRRATRRGARAGCGRRAIDVHPHRRVRRAVPRAVVPRARSLPDARRPADAHVPDRDLPRQRRPHDSRQPRRTARRWRSRPRS